MNLIDIIYVVRTVEFLQSNFHFTGYRRPTTNKLQSQRLYSKYHSSSLIFNISFYKTHTTPSILYGDPNQNRKTFFQRTIIILVFIFVIIFSVDFYVHKPQHVVRHVRKRKKKFFFVFWIHFNEFKIEKKIFFCYFAAKSGHAIKLLWI